jgi:transcriptional regulator with XRE-family HTH domain
MSARSNVIPNTRLRELRRARGFTQKGLADLIQVSLDTERDWEYGRIALPRIRQLKALSDILGVPMGQLGFVGLGQPGDDAIDVAIQLVLSLLVELM